MFTQAGQAWEAATTETRTKMNLLKFFSIVSLFFILAATPSLAYYYNYQGSGVYNYNRYGYEYGHNPFYARTSGLTRGYPYAIGSQMYIRNELDYHTWRNPSLLEVRRSTNNHRYLTGLGSNRFRLYHSSGYTGDLYRNGVWGRFN